VPPANFITREVLLEAGLRQHTGDRDVAGRIERDRGAPIVLVGVAVHELQRPHVGAVGGGELADEQVAAGAGVHRPAGDHDVARRIDRDRRHVLVLARVAADRPSPELAAGRSGEPDDDTVHGTGAVVAHVTDRNHVAVRLDGNAVCHAAEIGNQHVQLRPHRAAVGAGELPDREVRDAQLPRRDDVAGAVHRDRRDGLVADAAETLRLHPRARLLRQRGDETGCNEESGDAEVEEASHVGLLVYAVS
jgi:hypothetical protein